MIVAEYKEYLAPLFVPSTTFRNFIISLLLGLKDLGEILLSKFKWGHGFYEMNADVLNIYAACKTGTDVVAAQQKYLQDMVDEDAAARLKGTLIINIGPPLKKYIVLPVQREAKCMASRAAEIFVIL